MNGISNLGEISCIVTSPSLTAQVSMDSYVRGKSSTPNGLIICICHLNDVLCPEVNQVLTEYCHPESFLKIGPSKILSKFEKN